MSKDRSQNPEVLYGNALAEVVFKGSTKSTIHRTGTEPAPPRQTGGSQNFWVLLWALRVALGWRMKDSLAGFERAYRAARLRAPTPQFRSVGWMGTEAGSLLYLPLHFLGWLVVWVTTGLPEAREWLRFTLAMLEVCSTPEGRCGLVGQRSARPGMDGPQWHDALLEVKRTGKIDQWAPRNKKGQKVPLERTEGWIWPMLHHYREEIHELGKTVPTGVDAFEVLQESPLQIRTEYRWAHRPDGTFVAVWVDSRRRRADIHGSTFPILARKRKDGGTLTTLPRGGGAEHNRGNKKQGSDQATCSLSENYPYLLRYTARRSKPSPDCLQLTGTLVLRSSDANFGITEILS